MKKKSIGTPAKALGALEVPPSRLLDDVRTILRAARRKAYAAANFVMVEAYWSIGRRIVEEEQGGKQRADYGSYLIRDLARQLGDEFGNGVSVANLWNFRQFYLTFPDAGKLYALRRELTWTHWRLVMRVEDGEARNYYYHHGRYQQLSWFCGLVIQQLQTLNHRLGAASELKPQSEPAELEFGHFEVDIRHGRFPRDSALPRYDAPAEFFVDWASE